MRAEIPPHQPGRQAAAQKQDAPPGKFKQQKHCKQRSDGIPEIEISVPEPRKVAGRPAERTRLPGHPQIAAAPDLRQQKPHCPCKNRQCGHVADEAENGPVENAVPFIHGETTGSVPAGRSLNLNLDLFGRNDNAVLVLIRFFLGLFELSLEFLRKSFL